MATRVITGGSYQAVDLGLEASLLAGILAGYVTGLVSGVLISLPAMFNGEYLTMPLLAAVGVLGGLLRDCAPDTEEIWRFSPLLDLSIYRLFQRGHDHRRTAFQLFFLLAIVLAEFLRETLGRLFAGSVFYPAPALALAAPAGDRARLRDHAVRGDAAAQDLEQRPQRDQAGGAGAVADEGAAGGALQPDQPALPVQHAELGLLADPDQSGPGARGGLQALQHPAAACCASTRTSARCATS